MDNKTKIITVLNFARPYVMVVLVIFIIQSVVVFSILGALEKNALSTIDNMIRTNIDIIDRSMEEVRNTAMSISKNNVVKQYFKKEDKDFGVDELQNIHSSLMSYYTENENILDICLQNNKADVLVNSTTLYRDTAKFYDNKIKSDKLSAKELMQNSMNSRGFDIGGMALYDGVTEAFPYSLRVPQQGRDLGSINVYISAGRLFLFLNELIETHSGGYSISAPGNISVAGTKGYDEALVYSETDVKRLADNASQYNFQYHSPFTDWSYTISLDKDSVLGDIILLMNVSLLFNFLALILGLFICFHIALNKSKDYNKIADILKLPAKNRFAIKKNEFNGIYSAISDMQEENKKYLYGSGQNLLKQLLEGDPDDEADILMQLKEHNIDIAKRTNAVLVICYENKRDTEMFAANFKSFMVQEISGIIEDAYIYFADKNKLAVIFSACREGDFHDEVRRRVIQLKCEIFSKYNIAASFGSDEEINGISGIKAAYSNASEVIGYSRITDYKNPNIIFYRELPSASDKYYYPLKLEKLLFEHISACNFEGAKSVLDNVRHENFEKRNLSLDNIRSLLKELEISLQKYCDSAAMNISFFKSSDSVNSFFEYAENVLYLLCDNRKETNDKNKALCDEIVKYLNEHYADYDLSLVHLSERFNINASTMSQIFKKNMNYTWSSYLENIRIEHAVELIKMGGHSIKEIAALVGFTSDTTFRRCFKRVKGVNPKNYIPIE